MTSSLTWFLAPVLVGSCLLELDASRAKQAQAMEKMRQQFGPEQFRTMQAQMETGMAQAAALQDVPEENVLLMGKYRDRVAVLGRR